MIKECSVVYRCRALECKPLEFKEFKKNDLFSFQIWDVWVSTKVRCRRISRSGLSSGRKGRGGKNIFQTQTLQIACTHLLTSHAHWIVKWSLLILGWGRKRRRRRGWCLALSTSLLSSLSSSSTTSRQSWFRLAWSSSGPSPSTKKILNNDTSITLTIPTPPNVLTCLTSFSITHMKHARPRNVLSALVCQYQSQCFWYCSKSYHFPSVLWFSNISISVMSVLLAV